MNTLEKIKKIIESMEIPECEVTPDPNSRRISVLISDRNIYIKNNLSQIVHDFNHIAQLVAKKLDEPPCVVDVNNYRLERERIIIELAKAAARKTHATKTEVSLPAMNSYERRLVHTELAANPDVKTESVGEGKARYVVVRLVE